MYLFPTNLTESTAIFCIFMSSITRDELISPGNLFIFPSYYLPKREQEGLKEKKGKILVILRNRTPLMIS